MVATPTKPLTLDEFLAEPEIKPAREYIEEKVSQKLIWENIPHDEQGEIGNIFNLAPDWIIEILSPNQSATKVVKKIIHCLQHGTEIGWLIDPAEKSIFIYHFGKQVEVVDDLGKEF